MGSRTTRPMRAQAVREEKNENVVVKHCDVDRQPIVFYHRIVGLTYTIK